MIMIQECWTRIWEGERLRDKGVRGNWWAR